HVARFTGTGEMGMGNTFGINRGTSIYVRPKSLIHMSFSELDSVWLQITNRASAVGSGTGENTTDGLRLGIIGSSNPNINGTAAIYNQEKKPLLLSSDAITTTINPATGVTGERVRITNVSTPTNYASGLMGPYNPAGLPASTTRVSISQDPSNPVTRPLSLLHLGYNTTPYTNTDGWRSWMDVGMFVSNKSDHVYLGLKSESLNPNINRQDAVLGWGDNTLGDGVNGSDNLRFIFTSTTTASQFPANSSKGLEVARMIPDTASTLPTNFGMMGIGDFSPGSPNNGVTAGVINYVDAKLDIDGDLRIRTVVKKDTLMRVLVIDTTDHNRVYYRDIALGTGGKGFYSCADTTGADTLISDSRINLNNYNLYFEKNDSLGVNHVGVGYNCGDNLRAKFSVQQIHPVMVNQSTIAISGVNRDTSNTINKTFTGVEGAAIGLQTLPKVVNRGGYFGAKNSQNTRGLVAEVPSSIANTSSAIGGEFIVSAIANDNRGVSVACTGNGGTGNSTNIGVFGNAANSGVSNVGGFFLGNSSNNTNGSAVGVSGSAAGSSVTNVGGTFSVVPNYNAVNIATSGRIFSPVNAYTYPSNVAIGVYGYSNTNPTNEYAGFFDGDVWINGPATATGFAVTTSDQNFKSDINPIHNADSILMEVKPKTFYFDTLNPYGFNFSNRKQYGLLAQQVETILPELVSNEYKPATVDSIGTIIKPGVNYKALNYDAFISILIKGHQEQSKKIDSLQLTVNNRDSIINDLNDRLTHL
ncbi:MAG: tail fiber domain-containing protein, partial [Flavobacteriales bacterium]|nr:tail fiber domain-containing protein [Flavobacteriales bacterium]